MRIEVLFNEVRDGVDSCFSSIGEARRGRRDKMTTRLTRDHSEKRSAPLVVFEQTVPGRTRDCALDAALTGEQFFATVDADRAVMDLIAADDGAGGELLGRPSHDLFALEDGAHGK